MIEISPWVLDLILIGVAAEFAILYVLLKTYNAGFLIQPLFFFLLSGAFLLFAVRLMLSSVDLMWIGATLFAALVSHLLLLSWAVRRYSTFYRRREHHSDVPRSEPIPF